MSIRPSRQDDHHCEAGPFEVLLVFDPLVRRDEDVELASGEGKEAMAKMLKVELRHLGSKEVQGKKDEELHKDITEGTGKMKPVKGLTDAELTNLLAYLRTLKQK